MKNYDIPFASISFEVYKKLVEMFVFDDYSLKSTFDFDFNLPEFIPYFVEHNKNYYIFIHAFLINKALVELGYEPLDNDWKRYNCVLRTTQEEPFIRQFSPPYVASLVKKQLHLQKLTDKMIDERLNKFTVEKGKMQLHGSYSIPHNVVYRFEDCVYYDINKAHMDALIEIFPELKNWFISVAKKSKKDKRYKNIANFYVGILGKENGKYRKTYEWIVDRTTKKVEEVLGKICGPDSRIVYQNTDGFVVQHPLVTLETSDLIGDLKLETEETTFYMFSYEGKKGETTSYKMLQYGEEKKCISNIQIKDFEYIDLRQGKVVTYKEKANKEKHTKYHENLEIWNVEVKNYE